MAQNDKKTINSAEPVQDKAESKTSPFNHLLAELLEKNPGAFIGEAHIQPALRQSLTYLLPLIKAKGVKTLSIELPQATIDSMFLAESTEKWMQSPDSKAIPAVYRGEEFCELARKAHKLGFKVLGHEEPDPSKPFLDEYRKFILKHFSVEFKEMEEQGKKIDDPTKKEAFAKESHQKIYEKVQQNEKLKAELQKITEEYHPMYSGGTKRRNIYAADYIDKNKDKSGKIVVLGGAVHSQQHGALDPESLQQGALPLLNEYPSQEGLDRRLKIPAINTKLLAREGEVGSTKAISPNYIYETILPNDLKSYLKENKITSWPPPSGIPPMYPLPAAKNKGVPETPTRRP